MFLFVLIEPIVGFFVNTDMIYLTEREKIAHLLRRFGLGASEAELDYYGKDGLKGAIDRLFDYKSLEEPFQPDLADMAANGNVGNPRFAQNYWYTEFVTSIRPLEKQLSIFWHDHFATSAQKVASGTAMFDHTRLLYKHATGNFTRMLEDVSKDPAMLFWLDNQENVKGKPNENFAREVMELFTMGVDNGYTQHDIEEAARAFTGWSFGVKRGNRVVPLRNQLPRQNVAFYFDRVNHDSGTKTVLGNKGEWTGDEVLGLITAKAQTARYITEKMWSWFAYENPEKEVIDRMAKKFRDSGLEISVLVRAIMESEEFYSEKAIRRVYKNPMNFTIPVLRQLGVGQFVLNRFKEFEPGQQPNTTFVVSNLVSRATTAMGMEMMYPPDVAGWGSGAEWISTATVVERIKFADAIFGNAGNRAQSLRWPAMPLFVDNPTAEGAVDRLLSLFDIQVSESKRAVLVTAAKNAGEVNQRNANTVAHAVTRLIFGSPEFQFC